MQESPHLLVSFCSKPFSAPNSEISVWRLCTLGLWTELALTPPRKLLPLGLVGPVQHLSLCGGQASPRLWEGGWSLVAWPLGCKAGPEQGCLEGCSDGGAAFTEVWGGCRDPVLKGSPVWNWEVKLHRRAIN